MYSKTKTRSLQVSYFFFGQFQNFTKIKNFLTQHLKFWSFINFSLLHIRYKIWARSVQSFWHLLDTNPQTDRKSDKQSKNIDRRYNVDKRPSSYYFLFTPMSEGRFLWSNNNLASKTVDVISNDLKSDICGFFCFPFIVSEA